MIWNCFCLSVIKPDVSNTQVSDGACVLVYAPACMHVLVYAPIFKICVMGLYICIFMVGSVCDNIFVPIRITVIYFNRKLGLFFLFKLFVLFVNLCNPVYEIKNINIIVSHCIRPASPWGFLSDVKAPDTSLTKSHACGCSLFTAQCCQHFDTVVGTVVLTTSLRNK